MKYRFLSLTAILIGMGSSAIMQTYLSVSMPSIVNDLGDMSLYNWVFGAYMLASTVTIPLFGKLADVCGRRKVYLTGLILFSAGLTLCGLTISLPLLVACRALMGIGAGAITPAALGIIGELFGERDLPKVFGLMGLIQVLSNLTGPLLGGFLSDTLSWRWGFFLFLPLELTCALLICIGPAPKLPNIEDGQKKTSTTLRELDWIGTLLLSFGLVCLVLGLQLISWKEDAAGIILTIMSLLIFVFSVRWEKKCREPLIPLNLLQKREVKFGMISLFLLGIINNSSSIFLSLFYQSILGKSATNAGMLLIPMLVSVGVASALCGRIPKRNVIRLRLLLWLMAGLSSAGISLFGKLMGGLVAVFFSVPIGLCLGFLIPFFLGGSQTSADDSNRATSGGLAQLSRNLGGTLGVSLLGIWISGPFPIGTGLVYIFLSFAIVCGVSFLYTFITFRRKTERGQHDDPMV